jgi:hypothetical protein
MEMKVNKRKSTTIINKNKRVNNEEDHQQWNSSKTKINDENRRWESSHVWNEHQHGERQLSMMIITKRKSSECMWNVVCPRRVCKNGVSNPPLYRPRPSSPFPKIYTKLVNKHVSPTGEMGDGG